MKLNYKIINGFVYKCHCQLWETRNLVLSSEASVLNHDRKSLLINPKLLLESSETIIYHWIIQEVSKSPILLDSY